MKPEKLLLSLLVMLFSGVVTYAQEKVSIAVSESFLGTHIEKVWLQSFDTPTIHITKAVYKEVTSYPDSVSFGTIKDYTIVLGKERKRPFMALRMPIYKNENGKVFKLSSYELAFTEQPAVTTTASRFSNLARNTVPNSVLASGNWYKIAVSNSGICKITYDFVKNNLGLSGNIETAKIRLFGNGGTMIDEDNSVFRHDDLQENAIVVSDGGDGVFGAGDYILFYTTGTTKWTKDSAAGQFHHQKNLYEDKSYYFLNFGEATGLRMSQYSTSKSATVTVDTVNDYAAHEEDLVNVGKIGKDWMGEDFGTSLGKVSSRSFTFSLGQVSGQVNVKSYVASVSTAGGNTFTITANGNAIDNFSLSAGSLDIGDIISIPSVRSSSVSANGSVTVGYTYQPGASDAVGYLNYIELNWRRLLSFPSGQFPFRDWKSAGAGNVARYNLGGANRSVQVWDITNPIRPESISGSLSGSTYSFVAEADFLHEYVAFDGGSFNSPEYIGKVENQNLHATSQTKMIIITAPEFYSAASRLAEFHRGLGLSVVIETPQRIYNEFSSGSQDICGIRDFVKMLYDRAGSDTSKMPKYLLLFGDGSYDYKSRISNNQNYVPVYESNQSHYLLQAFSNDDIYTFLDDNENIGSNGNAMDIGVGRLTANTAADAEQVVDKIMHYKSSATLGPWRLLNTYIADDEDNAGMHLSDAEGAQSTIDDASDIYNAQKVYLDNYEFVSTPGGARCPEANTAINNDVYKGTFLMNYTGHGNTATLAHERILTADDFNTWTNYDKMPFIITGTCDFAQFDNPANTSSGERLVMKNNGGAIAMLTTTQAVYATENAILNRLFLSNLFTKDGDNWRSFGEAFRNGKNYIYLNYPGATVNSSKYVFLGDPALMPDFPVYQIQTDSVIDISTQLPTDSIKALGGYTISGSVLDGGSVLTDFNGILDVTFYDKRQKVDLVTARGAKTYYEENNIIYKGRATVIEGRFRFSFIAPKDINYEYGAGKISYYAQDGTIDAGGVDKTMIVGGSSDNPYTDNEGPIVKPYMNDTLFVDGGITGTNTSLYVTLYDEIGINVTGNSVGHDLMAVLDGDVTNPYILNDYYQTAENDYQHGYVTFPVSGLADGRHSFTVKAWDVNNNSGIGTVNFVVHDGEVVVIDKLGNYPNPFSTLTHFVFEHNHPDEALSATIRIYNVQGVVVKTINQDFTPTGSRTNELTWDGRADNGALLPTGMYVYRLKITTASGVEAMAHQKLIIMR